MEDRISLRAAALLLTAAALLGGCAVQTAGPIAPQQQGEAPAYLADATPAERIERLLTGRTNGVSARRDGGPSWMAPDHGSGVPLYISEFESGRVDIVSYPGGTPIGTLTGLLGPSGICTDGVSRIWVTDTLAQRIVEYRVGSAKRGAVLKDPDEYPISCSFDATSGNLAVTNLYSSANPSLGAGNVVIYENARGKPAGPYYDSVMYYVYFCGYDANGDLFFDGESYGGQFRFAELPAGQSSIVNIGVDQSIEQPGDVEPNGAYVALGDQQANVVYQLSVSGSEATVVGTTVLQRAGEVEQFALSSRSVVAAQGTYNRVSTWSYPGGGSPSKSIRDLATPIGLAFAPSSDRVLLSRKYASLKPRTPASPRAGVRSWMGPTAASHDLLYVADSYNSVVDVYSYPAGKQVGTLTGFNLPQGECSDASGNVYITNTNTAQILEYAHAGTQPIAELSDPYQNPVGCAVDPTTGNLAVTNLTANGYGGPGSVAIYKHARGNPSLYFDNDIYYMFFCGYDDAGNLFVDGQHFGPKGFQLAELPSDAHSNVLRNIAMPVVVDYPGGVQWDGKDVAVGDQEADVIYRVHVTGLTASIVGTTPLNGGLDIVQFWKQGQIILGPDADGGDVGFWKYPAGGTEIKSITGLGGPEGATVSLRTATLRAANGDCRGSLSFISDFNDSLVDVYSGPILCQVIYGFSNPNGIAIDSSGNLYVAEKGRSDVAILAPPYRRIAKRLTDPGEDPAGIALCSGYIAVANLETNAGGDGSVSIYTADASEPSYTLQDPNAVGEYNATCDGQGNLYTSYLTQSGSGGVNEWIGGNGSAEDLTAISTGFPGGVQWEFGDLWVGNQSTPTITIWPPPFTQATKSITLQGSDDPVEFVVTAKPRRIFVADAALNEGIVFNFGGNEIETLPGDGGGLAVGVAHFDQNK
jgi:sugar lactone lactonase YvrE